MDYSGLVSGVSGLLDAGLNLWQNYEQREWASEEAQHNRDFQVQMYERQLDDNIAWRTHQEDYNSPEAQMQRYRDAGINPMYVVAGNAGGNMVQTPMQASGSGYGSSTPSPQQHRLSFAEAFRLKNEIRLTDANIKLIESEARERNANARRIEDSHPETSFYRDVWNRYSHHFFNEEGSMVDNEALYMANAMMYKHELQAMQYEDAKATFIHSKAVRKFELNLQEHKRQMFRYELSHAKSASEIFQVSAKWAVANQWINAGSELLGAATGLLKAIKAPASRDTYITGSNERHIYGDNMYNINN